MPVSVGSNDVASAGDRGVGVIGVECKCECDALEPTTFGVESDFQYVSTAPPISSVTPSNGVMILIPNDTYEKPTKMSALRCSKKKTRAGERRIQTQTTSPITCNR